MKSEIYGKGMIYAKVIEDSLANNVRLTTLELSYPRFIHSEFMTHRMFSRNASSSRAIPINKMLDQVETLPAMPTHWGKNQAGMQAEFELEHPDLVKSLWKQAASCAVSKAKHLSGYGLHKQVVNRILEPFQFIKVIVTATEWDNFFNLRLDKAAQPEIQELAAVMRNAMAVSKPKDLKDGQYHLPYILESEFDQFTTDILLKFSVARCARVSYLNHDNSKPNQHKDLELHDMLFEAGHWSPFEHQATPASLAHDEWLPGITHKDAKGDWWSGNFKKWIQYRNELRDMS